MLSCLMNDFYIFSTREAAPSAAPMYPARLDCQPAGGRSSPLPDACGAAAGAASHAVGVRAGSRSTVAISFEKPLHILFACTPSESVWAVAPNMSPESCSVPYPIGSFHAFRRHRRRRGCTVSVHQHACAPCIPSSADVAGPRAGRCRCRNSRGGSRTSAPPSRSRW